MNSTYRLYILPVLVALLLLIALYLDLLPRSNTVQSDTRLAMGTLVTISVWGVPQVKAEQAMQKAFMHIARLEEVLAWQRPSSEVRKINQDSRGTWLPVSEELAKLVELGLRVTELSHGAFSVGLQPLTALWGFSSDQPRSEPPPPAMIAAWLAAYPALQAVQLRKNHDGAYQIKLQNDSVGLDLGAVGKGYAIDQAIAVLQQEGVMNAIINAGGDLRVIGSKGAQPWRIGLQNPREPEHIVSQSLLRGNVAMMTSGDYERYFIFEGKRYHHILDPVTGYPAQSGLSSVSVQGQNASLINGLSTALFVLGAKEGMPLLAAVPGSEALLIDLDGQRVQSKGFVVDWLQQ